MDNPSFTEAPPSYDDTTSSLIPPAQPSYPQPGIGGPGAGVPGEAPPKYEAPKEGPYVQQPAANNYPGQNGPYPQACGPTPPAGYGTVQPTIVVGRMGFGPNPVMCECPNCHAYITTVVNYSAGGLTWLSAGVICLFGCWAGCCLIPFCIPELQDVEHKCPTCDRHIGTFCRL